MGSLDLTGSYSQSETDPEPSAAQALAESLLGPCCEELFADHGAAIERVQSRRLIDGGSRFCAVIGFSGASLRGSLVLGVSPLALAALNPESAFTPRDLLGELSNELLGRLKNKLLQHGVELYLTVPVVLRGEHFSELPDVSLGPSLFTLGGGCVWACIEVECFESFELYRAPVEGALSEGEALFF